MLHYAIVFLVIALIAGVLGFSGIAGTASSIAWILFVVFLILAVIGGAFQYVDEWVPWGEIDIDDLRSRQGRQRHAVAAQGGQ